MKRHGLSLFSAVGVEIEYMIVHDTSLDVFPAADRLLEAAAGRVVDEWDAGEVTWSNELVLHVIEQKTRLPVPSLAGIHRAFEDGVGRIQSLLAPFGARLMPSATHPWMNPHRETRLWPHGQHDVYHAFDRIFSCAGHGWSNLQSTHLNLPFQDDREFGRLHAAIRFLLPVMPAIAAASPFLDGRATGWMDSRLRAYRHNADRVFSITGHVVPEPVFTRADYERLILKQIYDDLAPLDPEGTLREEWVNARGAIARFDRNTIEIRVLDAQECPASDVAVLHWIVETLKCLCEERWVSSVGIQRWDERSLAAILTGVMRDADEAWIDDADYAAAFGVRAPVTARSLWNSLAECLPAPADPPVAEAMRCIATEGPLSRRLLRATGPEPSLEKLREVYGQLCDHLTGGSVFHAR